MMKLETDLRDKIRNLRKGKRLSQERLAEKTELCPTHLGRIERGEVNITICALHRIAKALDVSLSQLLPSTFTKDISIQEPDKQVIGAINLLQKTE